MQVWVGHFLPGDATIIKIAANRNREQIGMDTPKRLREPEKPERNMRLKETECSMPLTPDVGA